MRRIHMKTFIATVILIVFMAGCSDILDEQPRSSYTPVFFQSELGVRGGITSLYRHLRLIYGQGYYYNSCQTGTDEYTYAADGDNNFLVHDVSGRGDITPSSSRSDVIWNSVFPSINTANGIIENGAAAGVSEALIAEARFFRAFDYFLLVQHFGGVPLDLGAGELKFNTSPKTTSVRNTVPEVYTRAIFPDLLTAVNELPDAPRLTGTATKTLARLFLAKAYLTYGWWLENPNNIPTYPETARTDPDGHNAQWYFQQAYDIAVTAIDNHPANFGLQPTYYDVNLGSNDRNSEILLYADRTEGSQFYNDADLNYANGGNADNFAYWMVQWNYTDLNSSRSNTTWTAVSSVQREAVQALGRPWTRMAPTLGAIKNTFADKTNDSRYDGTFTTTYRGNWDKAGISGSLYNANFIQVNPGDAILTFLDDEPATPITYPASGSGGQSNAGAGILPGRSDFVISPNGISRKVYPGLWKLGMYRTNNSGLGQPNGSSARPFNVAKFSELYFVAAEAAVKGANAQAGKSARDLINVIRARAGKWRWSNNGNVAKEEDNSAAMTAATPATIDINYILAERSREYFGEGYRWLDLVRTQKWAEFSSSYQIGGPLKGDHTPISVTRNIQPYLYLRPIPQSQIDAMETSAEEKAAYQNPGYN